MQSDTEAAVETKCPQGAGFVDRFVRPRVKRGEYWVFVLLDPAGNSVGNTWGGIYGKSFEMPATLAFKDRAEGTFESAEHGVAIYRQPNTSVSGPHPADDSTLTKSVHG